MVRWQGPTRALLGVRRQAGELAVRQCDL